MYEIIPIAESNGIDFAIHPVSIISSTTLRTRRDGRGSKNPNTSAISLIGLADIDRDYREHTNAITYVQFLEDIEIIPNIPMKKEDDFDTISLGSNTD